MFKKKKKPLCAWAKSAGPPSQPIDYVRKATGAAWTAAALVTTSGVMAQMTAVIIQMNCPATVSGLFPK